MKKTKKLITFAATLALGSTLVFAREGGVGNGGVSVVCRDANKQIISAEVLDLYEGSVRYGKRYNNSVDAETKIELAQLKLVKNTAFLARFQDELANVRSIMHFVPKGNSLVPTNDAFPKIIKDGCNFEQLANYTNEGELLISQEIYDKLDEVNKAALFVHETVYANFREEGDKDSQRARKLTAELLAANADQKVIDIMIGEVPEYSSQGKKVCGTKGFIDERIRNCNSINGGFALVTRTKDGIEVYKDLTSGLLWSDVLPTQMSFYMADRACNSELKEVASIPLAWRLPSANDFREADKNGIRKALPYMDDMFWSSQLRPSGAAGKVYSGKSGGISNLGYSEYFSVRCVARIL